jgi:flagellar protein FlaG
MNELKPSNIAVIPAAVPQVKNGEAGATSSAPSGKQLPPTKATEAPEVKVVSPEAFEAQQKKVEEAVSKLNDYVQSTQRDLQFSYDEDAGRPIVTVLDRDTQQVIRRIPDDVVLNLARNLNDQEPIRLFTAQA